LPVELDGLALLPDEAPEPLLGLAAESPDLGFASSLGLASPLERFEGPE